MLWQEKATLVYLETKDLYSEILIIILDWEKWGGTGWQEKSLNITKKIKV